MEENQDYKYLLQDISNVYLGARYTYEELIETEDIPFKVKTMVRRYILPELKEAGISEDLTLEKHFYEMEPKGFAYQTYLQLKAKVKISVLSGKGGYTTKTVKLQEFAAMSPDDKQAAGVLIQEIALSKLALMTL